MKLAGKKHFWELNIVQNFLYDIKARPRKTLLGFYIG